jgi:ribose-phosphate pyrophosphokinase
MVKNTHFFPKASDKKCGSSTTSKADGNLILVPGTGNAPLAEEIGRELGIRPANTEISRFSDGECKCHIGDSVRGKDVYIIQTCKAPVNDSIIELLLTISAAKRSGAHRVTAVIPYFAYKHHRRGMATSTVNNSRFLGSLARDFSRMLTEMGVDRVITVDLQRPGQGGEACFFGNRIALETLLTTNLQLEYVRENISFKNPLVVVAPNVECIKKARKFQLGLKGVNEDTSMVVYLRPGSTSGHVDSDSLERMKGTSVDGCDCVIVDDLIDSGHTIKSLASKLKAEGANKIYVLASHGLFTDDAMKIIDESPVEAVVVTNSLPLPENASRKVVVLSVAKQLARIIVSEHTAEMVFKREIEAEDLDSEDSYVLDDNA